MIVCSAVKFPLLEQDGRVVVLITGLRHADCYERAYRLRLKYHKQDCVEGFITDTDKFLDRYEAKPEARKCNQLLPNIPDESRALYSEEIWPE